MSHLFNEARVWKVYAGAGCGKTWLIAQTIEQLLADGVQPQEIMYILFNRQPAQSFRARFIDKGYYIEDLTWWGTHHSICRKLLHLSQESILDITKWGKENGFDFKTEEDLHEQGLDEYGWDYVFSSLSRKLYAGMMDFTKEEQRLLEALKKTEDEDGRYCHVRYLEKALRRKLFPAGVKYVFVDEAQDNGKIQFDWLSFITSSRADVLGVMLAGDDKQAINSFKGGDPELFLDFPCDRELQLRKTYRLPPRVLQEANKIIAPVKKRSELTNESAKDIPGTVIYSCSFSDTIEELRKAITEKKEVLILVRNRCFLRSIYATLRDYDIPTKADWHDRFLRVIHGLKNMKDTGAITEDNLSMILPSLGVRREGELNADLCFEKGIAKKLRSGDVMDNAILFRAYEMIHMGGEIPLDGALALGFRKDFIENIKNWVIDPSKVYLNPINLYNFKMFIKLYGEQFTSVRVETIHSVKGEEADVVVLVSNITERVEDNETDNVDSERRVWYVASTRAREKLILTQLQQYERVTKII